MHNNLFPKKDKKLSKSHPYCHSLLTHLKAKSHTSQKICIYVGRIMLKAQFNCLHKSAFDDNHNQSINPMFVYILHRVKNARSKKPVDVFFFIFSNIGYKNGWFTLLKKSFFLLNELFSQSHKIRWLHFSWIRWKNVAICARETANVQMYINHWIMEIALIFIVLCYSLECKSSTDFFVEIEYLNRLAALHKKIHFLSMVNEKKLNKKRCCLKLCMWWMTASSTLVEWGYVVMIIMIMRGRWR